MKKQKKLKLISAIALVSVFLTSNQALAQGLAQVEEQDPEPQLSTPAFTQSIQTQDSIQAESFSVGISESEYQEESIDENINQDTDEYSNDEYMSEAEENDDKPDFTMAGYRGSKNDDAPKNPVLASSNILANLKGFADSYNTDLFSGAASFHYPLSTPNGRNGIEPKLFLQYSSYNKKFNSITGYGWSLPTNGIFRSSARGVDKLYTDSIFSFDIWGNTQELALTNASKGKYAAKIESNFIDFEFKNNSWVAIDKQGTKYFFGTNNNSKQFKPSNRSQIYKYLLDRMEDTNGNFLTIKYYQNSGQVYPESIQYGGNTNSSKNAVYEVKFKRSPILKSTFAYNTGFKIESRYHITAIEIWLNDHESSPKLIKEYNIKYKAQGAVERLESITTKTPDNLSIPSIEFDYYDKGGTGRKINLLKQVTYPQGGIVNFTYKPSTAYRVNGKATNPRLPFSIHTIHKVTITEPTNNIKNTTTYNYSGGHYYFDYRDAYKKEYAGFQNVEIVNSNGDITKHYFHQSEFAPDNKESSRLGEYKDHISKKGKIYRSEIYDKNNRLYKTAINKWENVSLGNERNFVKLTETIELDFNQDAKTNSTNASNYKAKAISYVYDDENGNLTKQINYGEITNPLAYAGQSWKNNAISFTDVGEYKITTDLTYAKNAKDNILSLPKDRVIKDQNGSKVSEAKYYYDNLALENISKGNLTKEATWVKNNEYSDIQIKYNEYGLPIKEIDPRGNEIKFEYGKYNLYPVTITNALGHVTKTEYDYAIGKPTKVTSPNNTIQKITYDGLGRTIKEEQSSQQNKSILEIRATYEYNDINASNAPRYVKQTNYFDVVNKVNGYTYLDGLDRLIQERKQAETNYTVRDIAYNALGQVEKESLPYFASGANFGRKTNNNKLYTNYTYDALERPTQITNAIGTTKNTYNSWQTITTDAEGNKKEYAKDANYNLVKVIEHNATEAYTTNYEYNPLKRLTKITDAENNVRNFEYNGLGQIIKAEDLHKPNDNTFGVLYYNYDKSGNIIERIDAKNSKTQWNYDKLNRVKTEDNLSKSGIEISYVYDSCENGIGKLCEIKNNEWNKAFDYSPLGLVANEAITISGIAYETGYNYNRQGNIKSITYPDKNVINYEYANGILNSVLNKEVELRENLTPTPVIVANIDYTPLGQITKLDYSNGITSNSSYDANEIYKLKSEQTVNSKNIKLQDLTYTYDKVNNITQITDNSDTNTKKLSKFEYDNLSRLIKADITNAANDQNYTNNYSYSPIGNILNKSDKNYEYLGDQGSSYANPHAVTSVGDVSHDYDKNGNLISNEKWTHTWDYNNRLTKSTNATTTIEYIYDNAGQRIKKTVKNPESETTTYYPNQYFETDNSEEIKKYIFANNERVATINTGGTQNVFGAKNEVVIEDGVFKVSAAMTNDSETSAAPVVEVAVAESAPVVASEPETPVVAQVAEPVATEPEPTTVENVEPTAEPTPVVDEPVVQATQINESTNTETATEPTTVVTQTESNETINETTEQTVTVTDETNSVESAVSTNEVIIENADATEPATNESESVTTEDTQPSQNNQTTNNEPTVVVNEQIVTENNETIIESVTETENVDVTVENVEQVAETEPESPVASVETVAPATTEHVVSSAPVNVGNSSQSFQTTNSSVEISPATSEVVEQPTIITTQNNDVAEPVATTTESSEPIVTTDIEVATTTTNEVELIVEEPDPVVEPKIYPYIVFHISDHLGGASVDIDENGDIISLTDYYPFGTIRVNENNTDFDNSHKFTGHEYDDETDLTYMKARYYDGEMGRFLSVDPVYSSVGNTKLLEKKTGLTLTTYLENPQLLNSYSYTANNPLKHVDANGEFMHVVVGAGVGLAGQYITDVVSNIGENGFSGSAFTQNLSSPTEYALRAGEGAIVVGTGGFVAGGFGKLAGAITSGVAAALSSVGVDTILDKDIDYSDAAMSGIVTGISTGIIQGKPLVPGRLPNFGTKAFFMGEHTKRSFTEFSIDTTSEFTANTLGDFVDVIQPPKTDKPKINNNLKNKEK